VRHWVAQFQGKITAVDYANRVTLQISLPAAQAEFFTQQVVNDTAGDALIRVEESAAD
jgi:hypothetical protein